MKELLIRMYAVCVCPSNSYAHSVYYILTNCCVHILPCTYRVCVLAVHFCVHILPCLCACCSCLCAYCSCLCAYTVCLSCPYMLCHVGYLRVHLHDPCVCLFSGYNFELNFFLSHIVVYSPCVSCFVYYTVYDWLDGCTRKHS